MAVRIIAKLDVKPPFVVKPVHFEGLRKVGKPSELAKKYYDQGADELVYIDIVSSLYQREILFNEIEQVANELFIPFAVGGGVKNIDDFSKMFHMGADKVVINTYAVQKDPNIIDIAARIFGSQAVVVVKTAGSVIQIVVAFKVKKMFWIGLVKWRKEGLVKFCCNLLILMEGVEVLILN